MADWRAKYILEKRMRKDADARADDLERIIVEFCRKHRWAVDSWKAQPHIKPLFDVAMEVTDV